jgi:hypothetical protein
VTGPRGVPIGVGQAARARVHSWAQRLSLTAVPRAAAFQQQGRAAVAREPHKLEVAGSIPAPALIFAGRVRAQLACLQCQCLFYCDEQAPKATCPRCGYVVVRKVSR